MRQTFTKVCNLNIEHYSLPIVLVDGRVTVLSTTVWDDAITEAYKELVAEIEATARKSLTKIQFVAVTQEVQLLREDEALTLVMDGEWTGKTLFGFYHQRRRKYVMRVDSAAEQLVYCDSPRVAMHFTTFDEAETWLEKSPYANLNTVMLNAAIYAERYTKKKPKVGGTS